MKKILFIINTMGRAGAEKSLINLLKTIDYTRYSVSLLSIINRGELFSEIPEGVRILNKNPSHKPILGTTGTWYIALTSLAQMFRRGYIFKFIPYAFKRLLAQIKDKRIQPDKILWLPLAETTPAACDTYDMAIAFMEGASTYYLAEKVKAKKKVAFVHVHYEKAGYKKEYDASYYKGMDYICCISRGVLDAFRHVYPEYEDILRPFPNIINIREIYDASEKQAGFSDNFSGLRILTVGRLNHQKGYDIAIAAFAKVIKSGNENIRWYVLGDGTEKSKLKKLIRKHNVTGRFVLLGSRGNPYPYIKQCDLYVQPSRFEGFPLTLQEALILQKPCITTNFEGVAELLEDGKNAMIIELSEENICNAIKKMADDPAFRNRIANAAKELVFDFQNKTDSLLGVVEGKEWEAPLC